MKVKLLSVVVWLLASASATVAQTTGFSYQGRLTDGGTAANGNYDLQFALWTSSSGGTQVGSTQAINTVAVSNGVFTVSLDFGANAFPGASRFLEISTRPAGSGSFTTLTPRQPITSTPYAVRSLNSATADSVPASGVPSGSGNYIQNSGSPQASSNFNISGNGTAAGTLTGGVVNATTQYNLNGLRILSNPSPNNLFAGVFAGDANTTGTDNFFFGTVAGQANTTGDRNSFFGQGAGNRNTTGDTNSFFGSNAGNPNTTGFSNSFFGASTGLNNVTGNENTAIGFLAHFGSGNLQNATAIGARARVDSSDSIVLGSFSAVTGGPDTKVGIGTTVPDQLLTVNGNASKVGGGSWATFSDERLKNIKGPFSSGLNAVLQLQPLRYEYKPDNTLNLKSDGEHVGFSARAVQRVIPEAVTTNDNGYLLVNNDPILWTMLNADANSTAAKVDRISAGLGCATAATD